MSTAQQTKNDFAPLAEGEYLMRMNRIEEKTTKKGDPAISVSFQVVQKVGDPDNTSKSKNRLVFDYMVLNHSNPKVVQITNEKIDKYLKAVGLATGLAGIDHDIKRLSEFTELPFIGKLKIEAGTGGYADQNKITSFKKR